jgi:hypothetical protein
MTKSQLEYARTCIFNNIKDATEWIYFLDGNRVRVQAGTETFLDNGILGRTFEGGVLFIPYVSILALEAVHG